MQLDSSTQEGRVYCRTAFFRGSLFSRSAAFKTFAGSIVCGWRIFSTIIILFGNFRGSIFRGFSKNRESAKNRPPRKKAVLQYVCYIMVVVFHYRPPLQSLTRQLIRRRSRCKGSNHSNYLTSAKHAGYITLLVFCCFGYCQYSVMTYRVSLVYSFLSCLSAPPFLSSSLFVL